MSRIELRQVSKAYGSVQVCHSIDLEIASGEFVTLLGPSGCGKTTTLNMLAGLEDCTSGEILLDDRRVNDLSPVERDVAMVFQNYALYPHMTVAQNIGFTLKMRGVQRDQIRIRVESIAASLELSHVLQRLPGQLSGGQQQRVAIGRALIREPRIFLFDEPFSNLDASLRVKMRAEVKQLHQKLGVTSIFVTHDQEEAMSISDRIAVMHGGRVQQFGTPEEIYARPANRHVASFIGSPQIELIDGRMDVRAGKSLVRASGLELMLPDEPSAFNGGRQVQVGVRPEHVRISDTGFPAVVRLVQTVGPATHITLATQAGELVASAQGFASFKAGDAVKAQIAPEHILIFDKETGVAL